MTVSALDGVARGRLPIDSNSPITTSPAVFLLPYERLYPNQREALSSREQSLKLQQIFKNRRRFLKLRPLHYEHTEFDVMHMAV